MTPRPYQTKAFDLARQAMKQGKRKLLIVSPTGSGKSYMIFQQVRSALQRGNSCVIIVPLDILSNQIQADAELYGIGYGMIQAGYPENRKRLVQISTYQSLANRELPDVDFAIIDEAHMKSDCHGCVMERYKFVMGFTATPARTDGISLIGPGEDKFDCIIEAATVKELTPEYLSPFKIYSLPSPEFGAKDHRDGEVMPKVAYEKMTKLNGKIMEHWRSLAYGKQTIFFGATVQHSKDICERFDREFPEFKAVHLDQSTRGDVRREAIADFKGGNTHWLCNYALFSLGLNVPNVSCIVNARPTESLIFYRQANGRGQRPEKGKAHCMILDHGGNLDRHGMPDEEIDWLEFNTGKKKKSPKNPFRRCPECYLLAPMTMKICEDCGYEFKQDDGSIRRIEETDEKLVERKEAKRKSQRPVWLAWKAVAKKLGKTDSWARGMNRAFCFNDTRFLSQRLMTLFREEMRR